MAIFDETVNIGSAPRAQFDRSAEKRALSNIQRATTNALARISAERGMEEGQAAGTEAQESGKGLPQRELSLIPRVSERAYNEGARASYMAGLDRDNREAFAEMAEVHKDDITGYQNAVDNYKSTVLKNAPKQIKNELKQSLENLDSSNFIRIKNRDIERKHREHIETISSHAEKAKNDAIAAAFNGDDITAGEAMLAGFKSVDSLVEAGAISSTQAGLLKENIDKDVIKARFSGALLSQFDTESPQAAYDSLDKLSEKVPSGFSREEWQDFISGAQRELNAKLGRQAKQMVANAKEIQKQQAFDDIEERIAGDDSIIMNPKFVDEYYQERLVPLIQQLPPEQAQAVQAQFMDRTKVMPNTIKQQITNAANSDNPELVMEAGTLQDRIDDIPGVVNTLPVEEQAYIQNVTNLMQNLAPEEAVRLARQSTDPKDRARIEAREREIKEIKKGTPDLFLKKSTEAFSKLFAIDPDLDEVSGQQMASEYGVLWENYYKAGMNEADAFEKTDKMIKRNWGETTALGTKRVMKYPPEMYYEINGDTTWIRGQLMKDIAKDVAGIQVKAEDVILMSNDITARTAQAGQPSYAVKVLIDGSFVNIGQWMPDQAAEIERLQNLNVNEAREERRKMLERKMGVNDLQDIGLAL